MHYLKTARLSRSPSQELDPGTPRHSQPDAERPAGSQQPGASQPAARDAGGRAPCLQDLSYAALLLSSSLRRPPSADASILPPAKRRKQQYQHGNYRNYYGYRLQGGMMEDPRVKALDRRWFRNKHCLDIGCNEGAVTLAVAAQFGTEKMLGLDIDADLVKAACRQLKKVRSETVQHLNNLKKPGAVPPAEGQSRSQQLKQASLAVRALGSVWFQSGDIVSAALEPCSMDVVLCLSVTKWVHLNQGDAGILALFAKVRQVLSLDGYFVLEPQPWRSYKSAHTKLAGSNALVPLDSLTLRPEHFLQHLETELGFRLMKQLHVGTETTGFNRPMYVLQKRELAA